MKALITAIVLVSLSGCGGEPPNVEISNTSALVELPDVKPPMLTSEVAKRFKLGMSKDESFSILQDAFANSPETKSALEPVFAKAMQSDKFDLTITQARQKLKLSFAIGKLVGMESSGGG